MSRVLRGNSIKKYAPTEIFMDDVRFVDTATELLALCNRLRQSDWVAVDTEFIREKTFYPRLCLIQVATHQVIACIDPLEIESLDPLLDILFDKAVTKIFHAARQDLEIFHHLRGGLPIPVFDTQIAGRLLGHGEQLSYRDLVQVILGVSLQNSQTRTNWALRPLRNSQIGYAIDDVRFLGELYRRLSAALHAKGREGWVWEDCARLSDPSHYSMDPMEAWKRVRSHQKLHGQQLAVLRALADWRERQAIANDKPRKWILADALLLELSRKLPQDTTSLSKMRGLPEKLLNRWGHEITDVIEKARQLPREAGSKRPSPQRLAPEQESTVDLMMAVVRQQALLHDISPTVIATHKTLKRLILGDTELPLLEGWRAEIAGKMLQSLLTGQTRLGIQNGRIVIEGPPE